MNNNKKIQLDESWLSHLETEFQQENMQSLKRFLQQEKQQGKVIYPRSNLIFNALNTTTLDRVNVVILGQDPYHGPNQAHGLCFSVLPGVPFPPSLLNIFKEIERDLGIPLPAHGCLQSWAEQGVLLLNATLTVEQWRAGSHQNRGWEPFTDKVIQVVNEQCDHVVFLLWGSYARNKGRFINTDKHLVLQSPHPSPLSAHRGFIGNGHFSKANAWLSARGKSPVDWRLPEAPTVN